jgi:hypothetical protein
MCFRHVGAKESNAQRYFDIQNEDIEALLNYDLSYFRSYDHSPTATKLIIMARGFWGPRLSRMLLGQNLNLEHDRTTLSALSCINIYPKDDLLLKMESLYVTKHFKRLEKEGLTTPRYLLRDGRLVNQTWFEPIFVHSDECLSSDYQQALMHSCPLGRSKDIIVSFKPGNEPSFKLPVMQNEEQDVANPDILSRIRLMP